MFRVLAQAQKADPRTERQNETKVPNRDSCTCGHCKNEKKEIDCSCCQEVDALNEIFHNEQV